MNFRSPLNIKYEGRSSTNQSYDVNWEKVLHIVTKHTPIGIEGKRQGYVDKIISYTLTTIGSLFNTSCALRSSVCMMYR